jgi:hypothetical protein
MPKLTIESYPRRPLKRTTMSQVKSIPVKRMKSRTSLTKALDAIVSQYVRTKAADKSGWVACYTCPSKLPIKKMQNGHYVSRSVRSLRWEEDNCRPQCYGCNVMHGGRPIDFRENLVNELGESKVKELEAKRKELFKPSDEWFLTQIQKYELLFSQLNTHA